MIAATMTTNRMRTSAATRMHYPHRSPPRSRRAKHSRGCRGTKGNYLDEVWTLDDRTGGITVADLNDNTGSERHFYHQNTLYHVYALTDETGAIAEAVQSYDAYGNVNALITGAGTDTTWFTADDVTATNPNVSAIGNPYFYGGYRLDPETGLLKTNNRYLSPQLGRFLNRNPWGYIHMLPHLYDYVDGQVTENVEPFSTKINVGNATINLGAIQLTGIIEKYKWGAETTYDPKTKTATIANRYRGNIPRILSEVIHEDVAALINKYIGYYDLEGMAQKPTPVQAFSNLTQLAASADTGLGCTCSGLLVEYDKSAKGIVYGSKTYRKAKKFFDDCCAGKENGKSYKASLELSGSTVGLSWNYVRCWWRFDCKNGKIKGNWLCKPWTWRGAFRGTPPWKAPAWY